MRDEPLDAPIPEKFEPSPYARDRLHDAEAHAHELETMTLEQAAAKMQAIYLERHESWRRSCDKDRLDRETFQRMLAQVEAWIPPSPDHAGMKRFMREQIETSMHEDGWLDKYEPKPSNLTPEQWLHVQRQDAAKDVQSRRDDLTREIESAKRCTKWVADLRGSLTSRKDPETP
jgi:hypothetical protein